jgi:hypothetical protein
MHSKNGAARRCEKTLTRIQICHREAANLCKLGELVFTWGAPSFKKRNITTGDFKNLKSVGGP